MRNLRITTVLVIALLCLPTLLFARVYYIDFKGGNDLNSGTSTATAWKRCPGDEWYGGDKTLQPGDTVYFKRGVVYEGMIKTVSPSVTYTVAAWGDGAAVIDGSGRNACFHVNHDRITITGEPAKSLILTGKTIHHAAIWTWADRGLVGSVFSNLKITEVGGPKSLEGIGIKIGGNSAAYTDSFILDNLIADCYSAGIKISGSGTDRIDISRNVLEGNGSLPAERCQVNLSSNEGQGVQKVRFHNNTVKNGGSNANGINCNNSNNEIFNNTIVGNSGHGISLTMNYNRNYSGTTKVFSNIISHNTGGYGIVIGDSDELRHVLIYNNVLIDNGWYDINLTDNAMHNQIANNTLNHSKPGHGIRIQKGCDNNVVRNNIIRTAGGYGLHDSTGTVIEDFNTLHRESGGSTLVWKDKVFNNIGQYRLESNQGNHSLWGNPLFADATELKLAPRSPCIGTGINLSSFFSSDKAGVTRPKERGWDRGAYQFLGSDSGK